MTTTIRLLEQPTVEYPDSDGKPMSENTLQCRWIVTIKVGIEAQFGDDPNIFVAGDLLWYAVEGAPTIRIGPDVMVAFGRPKGERGSCKQWLEGGIAPQVVFEVLSPGNRPDEMARKFECYDRYGVEEYYIYDPDFGSLEGWLRTKVGPLEPIARMAGFESPRLGIRFEPGAGPDNLRINSRDGEPFITPLEMSRQLKAERQVKEMERQRADLERRRADLERRRADLEHRLNEAERQRAERYAAKLRDQASSQIEHVHPMRLGYNTNGLAHHRLTDAVELLADEGYESVAITLDAGALDPYEEPSVLNRQVNLIRTALDRRGMARVVETGARFLLNPRKKHDPTLMDPDPARRAVRLDFLGRAIELATALGAESVSLWSGQAPDGLDHDTGMNRLEQALKPLLDHAAHVGIDLAFEPEPGMFIDTLARFAELDERLRHPRFQLTMDLGHVHCMEEGDIPALLSHWRARIVNIHIEDMVRGVHEHLMFGQGTMDFRSICSALRQVGYEKGAHVELSRHSHAAVAAVRAAMAFLNPLIESG